MPITLYPTTLKYKTTNGTFKSATAIKGDSGAAITVQVEGTSPTIVCEDNHRYICGEISSLNITPCEEGICDVVFTSGSTTTVLTVTPPTGVMEIQWADGFNSNSLSINTTYYLKVIDGKLGVATAWGVQSSSKDNESWELIRDYTPQENINQIDIISDWQDKPFALKKAIVLCQYQATDTTTNNNEIVIDMRGGTAQIAGITNCNSVNTNGDCVIQVDCSAGIQFCKVSYTSIPIIGTQVVGSPATVKTVVDPTVSNMSSFMIRLGNSTYKFNAQTTRIRIYGVRE